MVDARYWTGKRILIVSIYFSPEQTGIAPYTSAVARHLAARGASVTAVVGMPHYPHWRVFSGYEKRLRMTEIVDGVRVRRSRMYVPRTQTAVRRGLYEASFAAMAMAATFQRADAVVGVIPNLGGGLAAAYHAARCRAALGLIVQDVTGAAAEQSGIAGGGAGIAHLTRGLEHWILRRAASIAVVSEGFRPYVEEAVGPRRPVHFFPNWSQMPAATKTKTEARRELGWPEEAKVVLHAGNMGLKQGLENVVEAAGLVEQSRPDLRFVLIGDGNQRPALERLAEGRANVMFAEPRYGVDYANALVAADILLVNERATVKDMSLPSKLTSYFLSGRPVLAATVEDGTTAREMERSGAGLVVPAEDPAALVDGIDRLLTDSALATSAAESAMRYAQEHLTEAKALARTETFIADVIDTSRSRRSRRS